MIWRLETAELATRPKGVGSERLVSPRRDGICGIARGQSKMLRRAGWALTTDGDEEPAAGATRRTCDPPIQIV